MHQRDAASGQKSRCKSDDIEITFFPGKLHCRQIGAALHQSVFDKQANLFLPVHVLNHAVHEALIAEHGGIEFVLQHGRIAGLISADKFQQLLKWRATSDARFVESRVAVAIDAAAALDFIAALLKFFVNVHRQFLLCRFDRFLVVRRLENRRYAIQQAWCSGLAGFNHCGATCLHAHLTTGVGQRCFAFGDFGVGACGRALAFIIVDHAHFVIGAADAYRRICGADFVVLRRDFTDPAGHRAHESFQQGVGNAIFFVTVGNEVIDAHA